MRTRLGILFGSLLCACSDGEGTPPGQPLQQPPPVEPSVCDGQVVPPAALAAPMFVPANVDAGLDLVDTTKVQRAQIADVNGDQLDDLILSGHPGTLPPPIFVLLGTPDGRFADVTAASGLGGVYITAGAWGDVDRDGDVDLVNFVAPEAGNPLPETSRGVWLNDGNAVFTRKDGSGLDLDVSAPAFDNPHSITLADLDRDGALDVYLATWYATDGMGGAYAPTEDRLFRGLGDGTFVDMTDALGDQAHPESPAGSGKGRPSFGVAPGDYDDDGDVDLFVSAYGAGRPSAGSPPTHTEYDLLWRNDGAMAFADVGEALGVAATIRGTKFQDEVADPGPVVIGGTTYYQPIGGNTFGALWGDVDVDGDLDLLVTNIAHPDYPQADRTLLFVSSGPPDYTFTEQSLEHGLVWREYELFPGIADVDNDGLPDIAIAGQPGPGYGGHKWELYHQRPDHGLDRLTPEAIGIDDIGQPGWNWIDFDHDGDLDVLLAKGSEPVRLFRNVAGDANRHLVVRFDGDATGARVTLETSAGKHVREVTSGSSHYNQQLSNGLWFGLGGDPCARAVSVRWPDGTTSELGDLVADRRIVVGRDGTIDDL